MKSACRAARGCRSLEERKTLPGTAKTTSSPRRATDKVPVFIWSVARAVRFDTTLTGSSSIFASRSACCRIDRLGGSGR